MHGRYGFSAIKLPIELEDQNNADQRARKSSSIGNSWKKKFEDFNNRNDLPRDEVSNFPIFSQTQIKDSEPKSLQNKKKLRKR
jgi:hypothetical protein